MIVRDEDIEVITTSSGRVYRMGGECYPSVTTIIRFGDPELKYNSKPGPAAAIGSIVHYKILRQYARKRLSIPTDPVWRVAPDEVHRRINECMRMWHELELRIRPLEIEAAVCCNTPKYFGRIDMLAEVEGELTLLDIKTGAHYDDHVMQAAAYWNALDREPARAIYVYLDANEERNPEKRARVIEFDPGALENGFKQFLERYDYYMMPNVITDEQS